MANCCTSLCNCINFSLFWDRISILILILSGTAGSKSRTNCHSKYNVVIVYLGFSDFCNNFCLTFLRLLLKLNTNEENREKKMNCKENKSWWSRLSIWVWSLFFVGFEGPNFSSCLHILWIDVTSVLDPDP